MIVVRPHHRTEQVGLALVHQVAPVVSMALVHLAREVVVFDGWAMRGDSAGRGTSASTVPEAAVLARDQFTTMMEDINDAVWGLEIAAKHLAKLSSDAIGKRLPAAIDMPRCRDAQFGKDAPLWSDDEKCPALPDKGGLCQRHYSAWRRHCIAEGLDTSHHYEPAP
jgi:hypothetical protein